MYFELFLLDNAMMNLLICRLAAAICGRRLKPGRAAAFASAGAAYALGAFCFKPLMLLPCKLCMVLIMGCALPFKGVREYIMGLIAMFAAALITGGLAFFIAYATGGAMNGGAIAAGIPLRTMLIIASAAAAMPGIARRIRSYRAVHGASEKLTLWHDGKKYRIDAMVDSGNSLVAPVSGTPVIVAHIPQLSLQSALWIPARTVAGEELLPAFRPDKAVFCGCELDVMVALCSVPTNPSALLPPMALPDTFPIGGFDRCSTL